MKESDPIPEEIAVRLRDAKESKRVVRLVRELEAGALDDYTGYVCGLGESLVLLHQINIGSIELDGYAVLRLADLVEVSFDFGTADLYRTALRLKGEAPRDLPGIDLSSMRQVVLWVDANYPAVVLHRELLYPDECDIGRIKLSTERSYTLRFLSPEAVWKHDDSFGKFDDITSVQFDGRYENTLVMVAESAAAKELSE